MFFGLVVPHFELGDCPQGFLLWKMYIDIYEGENCAGDKVKNKVVKSFAVSAVNLFMVP